MSGSKLGRMIQNADSIAQFEAKLRRVVPTRRTRSDHYHERAAAMTTIPHTCVNAAATVDGSSPSRCEACLDYYRGQAPAPFLAGMEEAARVCDDYAATNEDAGGDRPPPPRTKTPGGPAPHSAPPTRIA